MKVLEMGVAEAVVVAEELGGVVERNVESLRHRDYLTGIIIPVGKSL
jgi:4-alpha-glucanotransferase